MNQDQLKQHLISVRRPAADFNLIFSGKESKKVDGLYAPDVHEIIIHNHNEFNRSENGLLYTGLHEYAHHIQFTEEPNPPSARAHNSRFWYIFNALLSAAEKQGLYSPPFAAQDDFVSLTNMIRRDFLQKGGDIVRGFGKALIQAKKLCDKYHASFEDYLMRVLNLPRSSAETYMKAYSMDVDTRLGPEKMRVVTAIADDGTRARAAEALLSGSPIDTVKCDFTRPPPEPDPLKALLTERKRIERAIERMEQNLARINARIEQLH